MGGVAPSDAVFCVRLAASNGRTAGGLCGNVGSYFARVDPGSLVGADYLTPTAARGKTHALTQRQSHTLTIIMLKSLSLFAFPTG